MATHDQEGNQVDDITTRLRRDCMSLIADEAADVIDRLRSELKVMTDEHRLACEDRDLMIRQRDDVRREYCRRIACPLMDITDENDEDRVEWKARDIADTFKWDCFGGKR
jgi:hypothetical protein